MQAPHIPVLLNEVLTYLAPDGGTFVDGTFGAGGYTKAILDANPNNKVIAFDRDPTTQKNADKIGQTYGDRFSFIDSKTIKASLP